MGLNKDGFSKRNQGKYLVGFEIADRYIQISYLKIGDKEPVTLSVMAEAEEYNIPFVLFRKEDRGLWYFGKEALEKHKEEKGYFFQDLLNLACNKENIVVGTEVYKTAGLVALFIKRSLSLLNRVVPMEKIVACSFTLDIVDDKIVSVLRQMVNQLQLPGVEFHFMGKEESFFYYNLYTPQELWKNHVYLYELHNDIIKSYHLSMNRQTTPVVTMIENKEYPPLENKTPEDRDLEFINYLKADVEDKIVSTVYLIGEGFLGGKFQKSVRYLCTKRRVFAGNNLHSKGACLCLMEYFMPSVLSKEYVYLGNDKLIANVGMEVLERGKEIYFPIMDGGTSWHDNKKEWDFLLEEDNKLRLKIIPLTGKNVVYTDIILEGLDFHKVKYRRIHMEVHMESRDVMIIKVRDKGFGEYVPSSGQYWEERVTLKKS